MSPASKNSFGTRETLQVDGKGYEIFRLSVLEKKGVGHVGKLPFSLRVLLENLLRQEDGRFVHAKDIEALAGWDPNAATQKEISFMPARVLLQDFTGVPCVVDLAAMREAVRNLGGDPKKVNPLLPAELVSTIRCRSINSAPTWPSRSTPNSNFIATWSVTLSSAGDKRRSTISRLFRRIQASYIKSTWNIWRASCLTRRWTARHWHSPIRSSARTRTPR